ncbi:MAG: UvrD-helicase domain-containing protein [Bdellovibrionales bacterium]
MSVGSSELGSRMIQAGAGAGKTTTLVRTFLETARAFRATHGRFPHIVITTFTRKATQELKERLFTEAFRQNDQELLDYLNRKSSVHISTIHGLLVPFLSRYGAKVGLNPEVRVVTRSESTQSLKRLCKKAFQNQSELISLLEEMSWEELVEGLEGYLSAWLMNSTVQRESVTELERESQKRLKDLQVRHHELRQSFRSLKLSETWMRYLQGFNLSFSSWDELENWVETLERLPNFYPDRPAYDAQLNVDLKAFLKSVDEDLAQPLLQPKHWKTFESVQTQFFSLAQAIAPEWLNQKLDSGELTMSDLELMTLEVLRRDAELGELFASEWDYWMVDEYQDTSPVQVKILKSFIHRSAHFMVGDPQQSIYLFRGARSEVFQEKLEEMQNAGHQVLRLGTNYRSRAELVHFFNHLFPQLGSQFSTMEVGASRSQPEVPAALLTLVPEDEGAELKSSEEVLTVLSQIQQQLLQGVRPESIAVLARTNGLLAEVLKVAQEFRIPVQCPSLSAYWSRREILDLVLLTQFLLNPHTNVAFVGLLRSPWFWVPDSSLSLVQDSRSFWKRAWEVVADVPTLQEPLETLLRLRQKAQNEGVSSALMDFISNSDFLVSSQFCDSTGRREANIWKFITELRQRESLAGTNLMEYVDEILEGESVDVENDQGEAIPVIEPDRVTLLTVHASKGLQFDHVYVMGLGQDVQTSKVQLFTFDEETNRFSIGLRDETGKLMVTPAAQRVRDRLREREQAESLRVFYVALTRAKETLFLSSKEPFRKSSWIAQLPLMKGEGEHQFEGGFYRVQKLLARPEPQAVAETRAQQRLKPLTSTADKAAALKVSVTGVLSSLKPATTRVGLQKVKALEKAQYGTAAHRIFEALALRQGQMWEVSPEWRAALEFLQKLETPPMMEIFRKGRPEWGFAVRMDQATLQGSIDLWAELEDFVYILDYKTGSSAHVESAFEQMSLYSRALRKMQACSADKPHKLIAIFPFERRVFQKEILSQS